MKVSTFKLSNHVLEMKEQTKAKEITLKRHCAANLRLKADGQAAPRLVRLLITCVYFGQLTTQDLIKNCDKKIKPYAHEIPSHLSH